MAEEVLEKASGILPEAWYDLIARIVPGALVTFLTLEKLPSSSNQLGGLIMAIVVFYIIGMFLDVISEYTIGLLRRFEFLRVRVLRLKYISGLDEKTWRQRGMLRPSQWQVVSKLFAEADMFKAIAAYCLIQFLCIVSKQACYYITKCPDWYRCMQGIDLRNLRILPWQLSIPLFLFSIFAWRHFLVAAETRQRAYMQKRLSNMN
jgi:hypothetical protein